MAIVASWLSGLRNRHFLLLDAFVLLLTPLLALLLRTDGSSALDIYLPALALYTAAALALRLVLFKRYGLYHRLWRFASVEELEQVTTAVLVSSALVVLVFFGVRIPALGMCDPLPAACGMPRSIPFIDAILVLVAVGGVRFSARAADLWTKRQAPNKGSQRVLIMGAGEAGVMIAKEMQANPQLDLEPVGFVDDDPHKHAAQIRGLEVLGSRTDIPRLVAQHAVDQVIIAMPTAPGRAIREVVEICGQAGVKAKTIPGMYELLGDGVSVNQLRDVNIEDLLRRDPVQTDTEAVRDLIRGRRVLITGGGGSIGGELCRQVLRCAPAQLVIVGHGENSVFEIYHELLRLERRPSSIGQTIASGHKPAAGEPSVVVPLIGDIRSRERMQAIFEMYRPEIVFHAAAHKHVPLMEANPGEAVMNNVVGTRTVVDVALATGVEHFVMISTDKAVNPTSIMGATKRAAELLVHQAARQSGRHFVAVRFGNVLGSRGSVVLTFKQQIAAGGPVTITHPEINRYFMTIPEAVQLVLQSAVLGSGGEVFVLDMGEPVRIVDLAQDMIRLSGLEIGEDIEIVYTGLRPGEKLYEELFIPGETYQRTRHAKIFFASNASTHEPGDLDAAIRALLISAQRNDREAIVRGLRHLIPEFQPPDTRVLAVEPPHGQSSAPSEHVPPVLGAAYAG